MAATASDISLYRIDPSKNMRRFYALDIQPNLFGGHSLVREWGRIGSGGQMKVDLFDQFSDAEEAYNRLMAHKQSRGYRHPMQQI